MKRTVAFILSLTLVLTASSINFGVVSAESVNDLNKKIEELEKDKLELKEKQGDLNSSISETEKKIEENLEKQGTVQSDIESIDQQLDETQSNIQSKENEITATNQEIEELTNKIEELKEQIEELKEEIKALEEKIEKREELLKERLRTIQKNGGTMRYIEVLLGSSSFADFITRTAAVNVMMDQDKAIMETLTEDRLAVETKKTEVEDNKTEIEDKKVEVEDKKVALESQKQELVALKGQLDEQMSEKETLMATLEEEHNHLEDYKVTVEDEKAILAAQVTAVEKAKELALQEKKDLEQLSKEEDSGSSSNNSTPPSSGGNGMFNWPVSNGITSHYGQRWGKLHRGLDFGTPIGTPVKTAAPGVVIQTNTEYDGSMNGYGNVIMIAHVINGSTYTTLYAHLNSISVSAGQVVSNGQTIGTTGNTGQSTGPHLHFEIHAGGWNGDRNAVNPINYLP